MPSKKQGEQKGVGAIYNNIDTSGLQTPLIILTCAGLTGLGYWYYRKRRTDQLQNKTQSRILEEGSSASIAERLRRAMGTWYDGTDEAEVMKAVAQVHSQKEWEQVERDYARLTKGENLNDKLSSELSNDYLAQIQAMLKIKPTRNSELSPLTNVGPIVDMLIEGLNYTSWVSFYGNDCDPQKVFDALNLIADRRQYDAAKELFQRKTGMDLWAAIGKEPKLTTPYFIGFIDALYNTYAGSGTGSYADQMKESVIKRFGSL